MKESVLEAAGRLTSSAAMSLAEYTILMSMTVGTCMLRTDVARSDHIIIMPNRSVTVATVLSFVLATAVTCAHVRYC